MCRKKYIYHGGIHNVSLKSLGNTASHYVLKPTNGKSTKWKVIMN